MLFPPMRVPTFILISASIGICLNKVFRLPLTALLSFVIECVRLSPEVLPVVSINACVTSMLSITIGTPNCFEMEHVKISVIVRRILRRCFTKLMKQVHCYFLLRMSEGTHISIVAGSNLRGIALTEFHLILLWVIKFFYSVVSSSTAIA